MASTKLGLESLQNNAANQTLANLNFALLNQLVQAAVLDKDLAAPPSSPVNESLYIVASSATGAWVGQDGKLAYWLSDANAWTFIAPRAGYSVRVLDETEASGLPLVYGYTGSAWIKRDAAGGGDAGMQNPMSSAGDLIVGGDSGAPVRLGKGSNGQVLKIVNGAPAWGTDQTGGGSSANTQSIILACSDETTALTSGVGKVTFRMPYGMTLTAVRASLTTAQVSGSIFTVDINESGTSILSTKLTIDNTEKTSATAAISAVISDLALADDSEITVDIDQVGDGTAKGLKVTLIGVVG
jgi:hypothetical protein